MEKYLECMDQLKKQEKWNELTLKLLEFVTDSRIIALSVDFKDFYRDFVEPAESQIRVFQFVEILSYIIPRIHDTPEAFSLTVMLENKVKMLPTENLVCWAFVLVVKAELMLDKTGNMRQCLNIVTQIRDIVENVNNQPCEHQAVLFIRFYRLATRLYHLTGNNTLFYDSCMKYLYCIEPQAITAQEKYNYARQLSVAALLSEDVNRFDELLEHPVMRVLNETKDEWLVELLTAFAIGDVGKFCRMKPVWSTEDKLARNEDILKKKVCSLYVTELATKRLAQSKIITFENLMTSYMGEDDIEQAMSRAIKCGLLKGKFDGNNREVIVESIRPKNDKDINRFRHILPAFINKVKKWTTQIHKSATSHAEKDRNKPSTSKD